MASEYTNRTPNGIAVFLGSAAAFVVVAAIFIGALASKPQVNEVENKRAAQRYETRAKLEAEAQEKLNSTGWVDKAKGTVHVPIADAMTMVVAELTAKKPAPSSVKVEAPLPMPVADPASNEPPPAALPSAPQGADTVRFAPSAAPAPLQAPAAGKPAEPAPAPAAAPEKPAAPPAPAAPEKPVDPPPAAPPAPAPAQPAPPAPAVPANQTENPAPTK